MTLSVSPNSISENGETTEVTAMVSPASEKAITVTIAGQDGYFTVPSSANTLTIPAEATVNSGASVTLAAVDNNRDEDDAERTVGAAPGRRRRWTSAPPSRTWWTPTDPLRLTALAVHGAALTIDNRRGDGPHR